MVADHRQAHAGLPEQRRSAVPRRAEPARLRLHAAAHAPGHAIRAVEEHRQRGARRVDRLRERLELRLPIELASRNDPSTFADSGGFAITTPANTTDWFTSNGPSWRKAPTYSIEDTLTWNRGAHTITAGGNFLISNASSSGQQIVPGITLGFNTDFDPAAGLFNTTNFPGASSAQLTAARDTYAVLTGRVASVDQPGGARRDRQVRGAGAEHARGRLQGLRHVRAGHVES